MTCIPAYRLCRSRRRTYACSPRPTMEAAPSDPSPCDDTDDDVDAITVLRTRWLSPPHPSPAMFISDTKPSTTLSSPLPTSDVVFPPPSPSSKRSHLPPQSSLKWSSFLSSQPPGSRRRRRTRACPQTTLHCRSLSEIVVVFR